MSLCPRCVVVVALSAVVGLLTIAENASAAGALPDPAKLGPYPIGVTSMQLVDSSRFDSYTKGPRTLRTEIWYPATEDARHEPKTTLKSYFQDGKNPQINAVLKAAFHTNLLAVDKIFPDLAVRNAKVRRGVFPLLLFSHGNGGMRSQSIFWCEHLASHGYIVVAPDHTGNCCVTTVNGKVIVYNDKGREQAAIDRPKDISFLIDTMTKFNKDKTSQFYGRFDLNHIGVAGHSFGGYTALAVADSDPRVKAIAPMAGVCRGRTRFNCPTMVLMAAEDRTIGKEGNAGMLKYYNETRAPHYLVDFKNGGHYSFTDMFYFNPTWGDGVGKGKRITNGAELTYTPRDVTFRLINGYTTAFFGKFLKGLNGYDAYLQANHDPKELIVKWDTKIRPAKVVSATAPAHPGAKAAK